MDKHFRHGFEKTAITMPKPIKALGGVASKAFGKLKGKATTAHNKFMKAPWRGKHNNQVQGALKGWKPAGGLV